MTMIRPPPAPLATAGSPGEASIRIWQNFYLDGQQAELDPDFVPHDGRRNARTEYREVALFLRLYHAGRHREAEYTGIVSPKFGSKTFLSGAAFKRFVAAHPGADVYFINPFPQNAYYSFNVWTHAEYCHPGLTLLTQNLFDRAGIAFNVAQMGRNAPDTLLFSNFWVGNERFWDRFMDLNLRLLEALERLPPADRKPYFEQDARYHDKVPLLPFIFERLFSTLLLMEPAIRAQAYRHSRAEILRAAGDSVEEYRTVLAFKDLVDEIDERGVYDERVRETFRALLRLKQVQSVHPGRDLSTLTRRLT
jgi:hypothetical protein